MLSIFVDPGVFTDAGAAARETRRFLAWAKSSAPVDPGGEVLMPGSNHGTRAMGTVSVVAMACNMVTAA